MTMCTGCFLQDSSVNHSHSCQLCRRNPSWCCAQMNDQAQKCTFGPVPSGRLVRSLGIDIVPFKTCTYGCIYCQLSQTTAKTVARKEFISIDRILFETQDVLKKILFLK